MDVHQIKSNSVEVSRIRPRIISHKLISRGIMLALAASTLFGGVSATSATTVAGGQEAPSDEEPTSHRFYCHEILEELKNRLQRIAELLKKINENNDLVRQLLAIYGQNCTGGIFRPEPDCTNLENRINALNNETLELMLEVDRLENTIHLLEEFLLLCNTVGHGSIVIDF